MKPDLQADWAAQCTAYWAAQCTAYWAAHWPKALALWSRFARLSNPHWCGSDAEAQAEGLTSSFAMIRLVDQAVVVNLSQIRQRHLEPYAVEILAHEIGHHIYCPANLTDNARMIARMRWALPTVESLTGLVANLYADLLVNDYLQRSAGCKMSEVYRALVSDQAGGQASRSWTFYMRIYEILWSIQKGQLATGPIDAQMEGDAHLGARLVRSYARDWLDGAGRFAALCLPYLLPDNGQLMNKLLAPWRDTEQAGAGGVPDGLTEVEPGEREGAIHPSLDPDLAELGSEEGEQEPEAAGPPQATATQEAARGQHREPFQYGEILKSLGIKLSDHEIAIRYYRERAVPLLIPFPSRLAPQSTDPLPEGLEPWDVGAPIEDADWLASVLNSPRVIPGVTTVQRVWGTDRGGLPEKEPLDLDLYVDSSGSMPNPQVTVSYLTLAGAIIALSALRAGARVQATLWSGTRQFETTGGFIRDEHAILEILTGYIGGSTAFPIHILRDTFQARKPGDHPAHILVISDDGVTTMFDKDEQNNSGWDVARMALDRARGGGTFVLNLWKSWEKDEGLVRAHQEGWEISCVQSWEDLVEFARQFSRRKYVREGDR